MIRMKTREYMTERRKGCVGGSVDSVLPDGSNKLILPEGNVAGKIRVSMYVRRSRRGIAGSRKRRPGCPEEMDNDRSRNRKWNRCSRE